MKRILTILIILCAALVIINCVPPIGFVSSSSDYDDFWTVPRRQVYYLGDDFVRINDLWVFASYRGIVEIIPINKVSISIISNPDAASPSPPILMTNGEYRLIDSVVGTGRKIITVSYENKIAEYSIEVLDPSGNTGPGIGPNPGDDDGSGIIVIWK